jgi:hypothetical protein
MSKRAKKGREVIKTTRKKHKRRKIRVREKEDEQEAQ